MAKTQALSSDKSMFDLGTEYTTSELSEKKPNWVNLAQLDGPLEDSLTNRFLYKPALRFHGVTGGIWGQGLSDARSVMSESRPPSYRVVESMTSRQNGGDACSNCDIDTLYNTVNISARSPLTLRRRNTIAVIFVAIALLAAVAAITGVILHFLHPKAMLRANVRFTIANRNFTDDMRNSSTVDFHEIARPLCEEMDVYFLTSELADFYLGCNVVSMRKDSSITRNGTAVHYTLDFIENKVTNNGERIKRIIMRKSGRQKTEDTLYLAVRDFLIYLRSLNVGVEVLPLPDDHPGRKHRPRIPWNEDIDFISRLPKSPDFSDIADMKEILRQLVDNMYNMTTKIDHMQEAINFINKTFHETHRPFFNLEEVLGNMSVSLGNLNQNLNSINATMNAFKEFLKQFGNTVFNIDDVIKDIDRTIGNLGNAVSFIEFSMLDLNGTVNGISSNVMDMNRTLTHVNRSVLDVNNTAAYSNDTLDSMKDTLVSLENAIGNLALKINIINNDADVFDISLKNINDTVKNTHGKLYSLHGKLQNLNSSMSRVVGQAKRLNETYYKINKTLENMNEPYMFINGTVLEVIKKLSTIEEKFIDLYTNMDVVGNNITVMNVSLLGSMNWMDEMVQTLTKFNLWIQDNDDTIKINLRNRDMIETVGMLLTMNGTLSDIGHEVDAINVRLDEVDLKLVSLEDQLFNIDKTLDDIDAKFKLLDKILDTINITVKDTKSSLNGINTTIDDMERTFHHVNVSFIGINDTLDTVNTTITMINKTVEEINETIINVNNTFDDLISSVNKTKGSALKLKDTILGFDGSVQELNSKLYNANESMRITKGKAGIATESYKMLNNTLTQMYKTLSKLRSKMDETNNTLYNTSTSLKFVNSSINAMQKSFQLLSAELSAVQDSFSKMNESMNEFGTVFPNIQASIAETQTTMLELQNELSKIDDELYINKQKRDLLVKKHSTLEDEAKIVADRISRIHVLANEVNNRSVEIHNEIILLNDYILEAESSYNKTEINIEYINETHDKIKDRYDGFLDRASTTNDSLNVLHKKMESLRKDFGNFQNSSKNYSNIDIDMGLIASELKRETSVHEDKQMKLNDWTDKLKSVDNVIWNDVGNPTRVHDKFETLVNKTEFVNETLNGFQTVLNDTNESIQNTTKFSNDMRSKLSDMLKLRKRIDVIEDTEHTLNKEIASSDRLLKENADNITALKGSLVKKLELLQKMKDNFSDINGTYNSLDSFRNLESTIKTTISELDRLIQLLNDTNNDFGRSVDEYKEANTTYQENNFDLSEESQRILNKTLSVMEGTRVHANDVIIHINNISSKIDDIIKDVNSIDRDIKDLESNLVYHKDKNNFVKKNRHFLEIAFNRSFVKLDKTYALHGDLLNALERLENRSKVIDERINEVSNVNMSIHKEKALVKGYKATIIDFELQLKTMKNYLETFYKRFGLFEESEVELEEVEREYAKYTHAVEHFGAAIENITLVQSNISLNASDISKTYDVLLNQLMEFIKLNDQVSNASKSVIKLKTKLNSTWENFNDANSHFIWLQEEFDRIKHNYTNFTATDIDLTESYAIEAMKNVDEHLSNLTSDLQRANESVFNLNDMYNNLESTYTQVNYDRTNMNTTIQDIIKPTLKEFTEKSSETDIYLDQINKDIRKLELSIKGVNDTIHITNKQLFIDRQKQLLADTEFPDLELLTEQAKSSLTQSMDTLNETKTDLANVIKTYENLNARLEFYPEIGVSIGPYGEKLKLLNKTISSTLERLNEDIDLLEKANKTLWIVDGVRYTTNETVNDMKERYQNVQEMLNKISFDVADIDSVIKSVDNGSHEVATKLSEMNMALDNLDDANKRVDDLLLEFSPLKEDFKEVKNNVLKVKRDFANITETFGTLTEKFAHINKSVYDKHLNQFHSNKSLINDSTSSLIKGMNATDNDLSKIEKLFGQVSKLDEETPSTQESLDRFVLTKKELVQNISGLLDIAKNSSRETQTNVTYVEPSISDLDNQLNEIEKVFLRQEKKDYFNRYYPRNTYESLNDNITETKTRNDQLGSNLKDVVQRFDELKSNLSNNKNIQFDISSLENNLLLINTSVDNNAETLRNIAENYTKMEMLLYAFDGSEVSDDETIDEMKKRYASIGGQMSSMSSDLGNMRDVMDNHSIKLVHDTDTIDEYKTLVTLYENVTADVYLKQKANEEWNKTAQSLKKLSSERNNSFHSAVTEYNLICDTFNETSNDAIELLKLKINSHIKSLRDKLNTLSESGKSVSDNVSLSESDVNEYLSELSATHNNTRSLRQILQRFPNVNESINNRTFILIKSNDTLKEEGIGVDIELEILHNDIKTLREMLIAQEKQDYIKLNAPEILQLLQKLKQNITDTRSEVSDVYTKADSLDNIYETVKNITSNESTLKITLTPTKELILLAEQKNAEHKDVLNEELNQIANINISMLNENGSYFKPTDTLTDVIKEFDLLKQTLQNVDKNVTDVFNQAKALSDNINKEQNYLKNLQQETDRLQTLNSAHQLSKKELQDLGNLLDQTIDKDMHLADEIKTLRQNLSELASTYKHVNDQSLQREVELFYNEIEQLEKDYSFNHDFINSTTEKFGKTKGDSGSMDDTMKNISHSLSGLKSKLEKAKPVHNQIKSDLKSIKSNLENITDSLSTNMKIIPKLHTGIEDLRERFRKQEILEYIKTNFPSVLAEYNKVNKTLNSLLERISVVKGDMHLVRNNSNGLEEMINKSVTIKIPVVDITATLDHQNASMANVIKDKNSLDVILGNLESVISKYSDNNESLTDIKKKFAGYETLLNNMNRNISELHDEVNGIEHEVSRTNSTIENYKEALEKFHVTQKTVKDNNHTLQDIETNVRTIDEDLTAIEETSESQKNELVALGGRFENLNSSSLERERKMLSQNVQDISERINMSRGVFNSEFNNLQKMSDKIDNVNNKLNQTVTSIEQLKAITADAEMELTDFAPVTQTIQSNIESVIKPDIIAYNETVDKIERDIDVLKEKFKEKEKSDYILLNLPRLLTWHDNLSTFLTNTKSKLLTKEKKNNELNQTIVNLQDRINLFQNIKISTDKDQQQHTILQTNISEKDLLLNEITHSFNILDTTLLNRTDWKNVSFEDLNKTFDEFLNNVSMMNETLTSLNIDLDTINATQNENFDNLNDTNFVLDRYISSLNTSTENKDHLEKLSSKLNETYALLEDVKRRFYFDGDKLFNLTRQYHGVTNSKIENLIDEIRTILEGTVGLRIPLANKLFSNRIMENYNIVNNRFEDAVYILNDDYTDKDDLKNKLGDVDDTLLNITLETEGMISNEAFYREDAIRLSDLLNQSNALLDKLEEMYKTQFKNDLLQKTLPKLKEQWNAVNESLENVSRTLNVVSKDIEDSTQTLKLVEDMLSNNQNVTIPTTGYHTNIFNETVKLENTSTDVKQLQTELHGINIFDINITEFANNKNMSVKDVKEELKSLNLAVKNVSLKSEELRYSTEELNDTVTSTNRNITLLNKTLSAFNEAEEKVKILNDSLRQTSERFQNITTKLDETSNKINFHKDSLKSLKKKYDGYTYDSSEMESLLNVSNEKISALNDTLSDLNVVLSESENELGEMNTALFDVIDTVPVLNETVEKVGRMVPTTSSKINSVNNGLDNITRDIPNFNIVLQDLQDLIREMNKSLMNENSKSNFADKALPILKQKYELTNRAFELTNTTLQRLADEMNMLNQFIETLKLRMKDFSTINISLTEINDNITYLENRLAIMQDSYNNVDNVVNIFRKDLQVNNIFGRNISLSDVEDQYKTFNKSLDTYNDVLARIEKDAYEMDDHFETLNDTMYGIDNALDRFETKQMNTQIMEKEIENIGEDVSSTKDSINDIQKVAKDISDRFKDMHALYSDVIQTTAVNNTLVSNMLKNTNRSLEDLNESITKLNDMFAAITTDFADMNETLFGNITTYLDLNNTLDSVKNKYLKLSKSLNKLEKGIIDTKQVVHGKNETLSDISNLLDLLNDTLFEEQVKFDFLKNNLGSLLDKFNGMKSPLETANKTVSEVTENLSNTSALVKNVTEKMKQFNNVQISLENDAKKLEEMKENVSKTSDMLRDIGANFETLQQDITKIDSRNKNITNIQDKYSMTNETLDAWQKNLTDILTALENVNKDTNTISNRTVELDNALDKLASLNKSVEVLDKNISDVETNLEITGSMINDSLTDANDLEAVLEEMKRLYSSLDNHVLLGNITDLMERLNNTAGAIKKVHKSNNDLNEMTSSTKLSLGEIGTQLNSEINKQYILQEVNTNSENALRDIDNNTSLIQSSQNAISNEANDLQNILEILKLEILSVNETLAEEKQKAEFIAKNFPDIETRYKNLKTTLENSNQNVGTANDQVITVADSLSNVKNRLSNISAIRLPLDSENKEVVRIQKAVDDVVKVFENVSKEYDNLQIDTLNNKSTGYDKLKKKYFGFDKTMKDIDKNIKKMNDAIDDINKTATVIRESVHDINSTVDEYIVSGKMIADAAISGQDMSTNIEHTNKSIVKLADEVQVLQDALNNLLQNYSHIKDPVIMKARDKIHLLLKSSNNSINALENEIKTIDFNHENTLSTIKQMNQTQVTTKKILAKLKEHIKEVVDKSGNVSKSLNITGKAHESINKTAEDLEPRLQNILTEIAQLNETFVKEQEKIDLIEAYKPLLENKLKNLLGPLNKTNNHISLTLVKLADLKYDIKSTGSRLDKFKTLNITTEPELKQWTKMNEGVGNASKSFNELNVEYRALQDLFSTINDRNISIKEMKKKFNGMNTTLNNIEEKMNNVNTDLTDTEHNITATEKTVSGLQTSMDNFKALQMEAAKTKQTIQDIRTAGKTLEDEIENIAKFGSGLKEDIHTMKLTYAPLNDTNWNLQHPKLQTDLSNHDNKLTLVNESVNLQDKKLNATVSVFQDITTEMQSKPLTRKDVDSAILGLRKKLNVTSEQLSALGKPIQDSKRKLAELSKETNKTGLEVKHLNETLHGELLKYNYVKLHLPSLKEKHTKVNTSYSQNIPNVDKLKDQIAYLVSVVGKIKEKMRQFGVADTDNSIKKFDLAIQKLNETVTAVLKRNKDAGDQLIDLKTKLWSNDTMFTSKETLPEVKARLERYNKTLDDINAASHTINIKLADLDATAAGVIGQLLERDAILTTTPATTTPSGPPEWLSFQSTNTGILGKDPAFATCSVEDLTQWEMMKITRVNKDGRNDVIGAWKLGVGARKAVRDRRIRVKRTKTATGGKMTVGIQTLQCEDEGTYYCSIDSYNMWPLESSMGVVSPPEDDLKPDFPTEVFEDKVTNFSCTGRPGYPNGRITWKIKREKEVEFRPFEFYSSKAKVSDTSCVRTETNTVEYQFNLKWNNTKVRCYIENTDFYAEGIIRLLPYDICNKVRYLGTTIHPYTPHKYIVCGKELNIMQCPGNTCYDPREENCVRCKAEHVGSGDPCLGKPMYTYVPHETDCKKYYICLQTKQIKKCTKGYFAPNIPGNCVMSYAQSLCGRKAG